MAEVSTDSEKFDETLLVHVAKLARLELSEEEKRKFTEQLQAVLEMFGRIDKVNVEGLDPAFHPIEIPAKLRPDEAEKWSWDPLANSRHNEGKYIKSPRIV